MGAASETAAAAALYETHRESLDDYLGAFSAEPAQRGVLFMLNGRVIGLDLFDSPATLQALLPKLVESCALDALDAEPAEIPEDVPGIVQRFLQRVGVAELQCFEAVGEGQDLRIASPGASGGALMEEGCIVHLCAFETDVAGADDDGRRARGSRIVRASRRGRGADSGNWGDG